MAQRKSSVVEDRAGLTRYLPIGSRCEGGCRPPPAPTSGRHFSQTAVSDAGFNDAPEDCAAMIGGGGGNRTRVRKPYTVRTTCLARLFELHLARANRQVPPGQSPSRAAPGGR